nr:hypothetical protein [Dongia mobilis]
MTKATAHLLHHTFGTMEQAARVSGLQLEFDFRYGKRAKSTLDRAQVEGDLDVAAVLMQGEGVPLEPGREYRTQSRHQAAALQALPHLAISDRVQDGAITRNLGLELKIGLQTIRPGHRQFQGLDMPLAISADAQRHASATQPAIRTVKIGSFELAFTCPRGRPKQSSKARRPQPGCPIRQEQFQLDFLVHDIRLSRVAILVNRQLKKK